MIDENKFNLKSKVNMYDVIPWRRDIRDIWLHQKTIEFVIVQVASVVERFVHLPNGEGRAMRFAPATKPNKLTDFEVGGKNAKSKLFSQQEKTQRERRL